LVNEETHVETGLLGGCERLPRGHAPEKTRPTMNEKQMEELCVAIDKLRAVIGDPHPGLSASSFRKRVRSCARVHRRRPDTGRRSELACEGFLRDVVLYARNAHRALMTNPDTVYVAAELRAIIRAAENAR
jgi:hypothetical protein